MIRVVVAGPRGRMGRPIVAEIEAATDLELVGTFDRSQELAPMLAQARAEVLVDVTGPASVLRHGLESLAAGVRPVLGASGLDDEGLEALRRAAAESGLGGLWVPNFSLASVLLQRFAEQAARYLPQVEIVEAHHPGKLDAPSGTARWTAERIAAVRAEVQTPSMEDRSRGLLHRGVPVHAMRLPGVVAEQEVRFGATGESLSLRHVSIDRSCFMPGVLRAVRGVHRLSGFEVGLDAVLDLDPPTRS